MLLIETLILCFIFFILCVLGTGTDEKNLKSYASYPDEVQNRIKEIPEYRKKVSEKSKSTVFIANFLLFSILFLALGIFIRGDFMHNFISLLILGQSLNAFDLIVIDLLWWRNTKRIRFSKIPEKKLYQSPKKHIDSFLRAFVMYILVALIDGYILSLF